MSERSPVDVLDLSSGVVGVSAGYHHTCALMSSGRAKCWGSNYRGQLGNGTAIDQLSPVDVIDLPPDITAVSAGYEHSCALTSSGAVKCWGNDVDGQLGDGNTRTSTSAPVDVIGLDSGVVALSAGGRTCAATSGGTVKCWGLGPLGDGTGGHESNPVDVIGLGASITSLSAGAHSCAVTSEGAVKCWGQNWYGELGDGTTVDRSTAAAVASLGSDVIAMSASSSHSCAITASRGVKCWGNNEAGQLGDGTTTNRSAPVDVVDLDSNVVGIATGTGPYSCAVAATGGVKCWGSNFSGQLGDGTTTDRWTPVNVIGIDSVQAISLGWTHACAVTAGGALKCWGSNAFGQLGDGTTTNRPAPADVVGLGAGVTAVSCGLGYTCAVTSAGALKCWGDNVYGQIGDGTTTRRSLPTDVTDLSANVIAVSTGPGHTCALTSEGRVKCWGDNRQGQTGNGTTTDDLTPAEVTNLGPGILAVSAGGYYHGLTCALTAEGGVKCWGYNFSGQLGNGEKGYSAFAVAVEDSGSISCSFTPTPTPTESTPTPIPTEASPAPSPTHSPMPTVATPAPTETSEPTAAPRYSLTSSLSWRGSARILRGIVKDSKERPVKNVRVAPYYRPNPSYSFRRSGSALRTDKDGTVRWRVKRKGFYQLTLIDIRAVRSRLLRLR